MTFLDAFVTTALQVFATRHAAAEGVFVARNRLSLLVFSVAELRGKEDTRRAIWLAMTKMIHWMRAFVSSRAFVGAFRRLCSTRHRRVNDSSAAFTTQLVERDSRAGKTIADVAGKLAAMFLALESSSALLGTEMFELDAAVLVTFVFSASLELCAFLLATHVSAQEIFAGDFLFDSSASALDVRAFSARWTFTDMTRLRASMWRS